MGFVFKCVQLTGFAVFCEALVVIKQHCITVGAPFWIGGELPVFVVRPHAPNREVCTVTLFYGVLHHIYIYGEAHHKIIISIHTGLVVHKAV